MLTLIGAFLLAPVAILVWVEPLAAKTILVALLTTAVIGLTVRWLLVRRSVSRSDRSDDHAAARPIVDFLRPALLGGIFIACAAVGMVLAWTNPTIGKWVAEVALLALLSSCAVLLVRRGAWRIGLALAVALLLGLGSVTSPVLEGLVRPSSPWVDSDAPDFIIVFNLGITRTPDGYEPGVPNVELAAEVRHMAGLDTIIFAQEAVYGALCPAGVDCENVHRMHRDDPDVYVSTSGAAACATELLKSSQPESPVVVVVAGDLMGRRAFEATEEAFARAQIAAGLYLHAPAVNFDSASTHEQTRGRSRFPERSSSH